LSWTINGVSLTREQTKQAKQLGLTWEAMYMRLSRGMSVKRALKQPIQKKREGGSSLTDTFTIQGKKYPRSMIAEGLTVPLVRNRVVERGWELEDAATVLPGGRKPENKTPKVILPILQNDPELKKWKYVAMKQGMPLDIYLNRVYEKNIPPKQAVEMGR
jgi:hypothetical protein